MEDVVREAKKQGRERQQCLQLLVVWAEPGGIEERCVAGSEIAKLHNPGSVGYERCEDYPEASGSP